MAVQGIDSYKDETRIFSLHVGPSGCGKSAAGASYPGPYHELDPDLRFGGIKGAVRQGLIEGKGMTFEQFNPFGGWEPIDRALSQLEVYRIQAGGNKMQFPYGTIGLGSLTSAARLLVNMAKEKLNGQVVGSLRLSGPGDSKVESQGVHTIIDHLKVLPCNVVVTGHIIDRWGKDPMAKNPDGSINDYAARIVVGKKMNLTDQLASSIVSGFDNVFKFDRYIESGKEVYTVEFCSDLAKNSFGIPPGRHIITGKKFYPYLLEQMAKYRKEQPLA